MNCIIIDDDSLSRKILTELVERTEYLNLIQTYSNAVDAINSLNDASEIDLIFLDIEMPEMSGMDFLRTLKDPPLVIIVSAREKYALESYQYNVTDYLLKPVQYGRFFTAVDRAKKQLLKSNSVEVQKNTSDEIYIRKNTSLFKLKYNDILWIEALENYVIIHTFEKKYTINFTMRAILNNLPSNNFLRVHRSYIINLKKINVIEDNTIVMKIASGTKIIPIGRTYRDQLYSEIKLINK